MLNLGITYGTSSVFTSSNNIGLKQHFMSISINHCQDYIMGKQDKYKL